MPYPIYQTNTSASFTRYKPVTGLPAFISTFNPDDIMRDFNKTLNKYQELPKLNGTSGSILKKSGTTLNSSVSVGKSSLGGLSTGGLQAGINVATKIGDVLVNMNTQKLLAKADKKDVFGNSYIDEGLAGDAIKTKTTYDLTKTGVSLGASIGSLFGPLGTAIGAGAGALVGLGGGLIASNKIDKQYDKIRSDRLRHEHSLSIISRRNRALGATSMASRGMLVPKTESKGGDKSNVVTTGVLHKEKNKLGNKDKGIPVIDKNGEKILEFEKEELILNKHTANRVEDLKKQYDKTGDKKYLYVIGVLIADELLNNTKDLTKKYL